MAATEPIKIAILAMGGEGGGVLADWIVELGERGGQIAQATSIPGVAQRTGATIYYVELYPRDQARRDGGQPVLALMPLAGDVDVVLASELMEAGRAVQRGLVTPERTILIASTHRVYSIAEKIAMGDGRADPGELLGHAKAAARRLVCFDMAQAAQESGSLISAVLFGALAATGVLPFSRAQFEATIERGGVGIKPSLTAFAAGYERASGGSEIARAAPPAPKMVAARDPEVRALLERITRGFPPQAAAMVTEGVRRLVDYQDPAYANLYLDRLEPIARLPDDGSGLMLRETARHLALWMSYEDTIRVAELKTRGTRFERVQGEVRAGKDQILDISEYMHPRLEEICDTLPAGVGRLLLKSGWPRRFVERFTRGGRVIRTTSLRGFLTLYAISRLKRWRRGTLRFAMETQRIERWLGQIERAAAINQRLAAEVAQCQRLVKGYSDTHARGLHSFETVMAAVERAGAALAPATLRELREAALADEHGHQLRATLTRHALA